MSPTGRSYSGSGYNTAGSYGYTGMNHSSTDYSQGMSMATAQSASLQALTALTATSHRVANSFAFCYTYCFICFLFLSCNHVPQS